MKRWITIFLSIAMLFAIGGCTVENEKQTETSSATSHGEAVLSTAESAWESSIDSTEEESSRDTSSEPSEAVSQEESLPPDTPPAEETGARIWLDAELFSEDGTIAVHYAETDTKDWIGIYPYGVEPGTTPSITWQYAVGEGILFFKASALQGAGDYWMFLCDNDGYVVLDMASIIVSDGDTKDYGAKSLSVSVTKENGFSHTEVTVTPSCSEEVTYSLYWSKDGKRLETYMPIHTFTHQGSAPFTVILNDCLYMPAEADGMEIAVKKGNSTSCFAPVSDALKVQKSNLLYSFAVLTDLHITSSKPAHLSHLALALEDIKNNETPVSAIFTAGDNTDRGTVAEYELLMQIIEDAGEIPPIYFAMGNHDMTYGDGYEVQVKRFLEYTGLENPYYSIEMEGARFIVLTSQQATTSGVMKGDQVRWLKAELAKCDPDTPVFLFLHQPLKDTVSGTLSYVDPDIQDWFGVQNADKELRKMLKEYPNAVLFTGHTHWMLESLQPLLCGKGQDASFVNCASVGYLWTDEDKAAGGSQGMYVEVYEDYILLRGREFLFGKWCASAQLMIPIVK